jgi:hypothetical protein
VLRAINISAKLAQMNAEYAVYVHFCGRKFEKMMLFMYIFAAEN